MRKKIKIFSGHHDIVAIEQDINHWLTKNPDIRIINVTQSQTNVAPQGWSLIISVVFEVLG